MEAIFQRIRPLGIDIFCLGKKFLVFNLVSRNLKVKYRRSIFGIFWTLLIPICLALIYYFVFRVIARVAIPNYMAFVLVSILPWTFFSQSISEAVEMIVSSHALVSKVPIPVQVLPYVGVVTNFITLILAMPVIFAILLLNGTHFGWALFSLIPLLLALFIVTYSVSLVFSVAFVFLRDIRHVIGLLLQLWLYATPVLYDQSMLPPNFQWLLYANPVALIFIGIRGALLNDSVLGLRELALVFLWACASLFVSIEILRRVGRNLVERI